MNLPEIVGVAGGNGSGKDTLADLRYVKHGVQKVGLSDILRIEAAKQGRGTDREVLREISTARARELGAAFLATMTLQHYFESKTESTHGISIVSIRRPAEGRAIQDAGGQVIWIHAERSKRYDNLQKANRDRPEDLVSYEEFCAQEDAEMTAAKDDPFALNMQGVREIADFEIENNMPDREDFKSYLTSLFELDN